MVIACTAIAAARPATSLSGRAAVNQYIGAVIATAVAASGQAIDAWVRSTRRNNAAIARTPSVPATTLTTLSAVPSDGTTACTAFATTMNTA